MRLRIIVMLVLMLGMNFTSLAASQESIGTGSYNHPLLKVEWTVSSEGDKLLLTGMVRNTSQAEIENVELIARALYPDRTEQGRERFVFLPSTIRGGGSAPFGMFFRISGNKIPAEIECTIYLERSWSTTESEQEFFAFTAKVPANKKIKE